MAAFRVVNVTNQIQSPGFFLDFGGDVNIILGVGKFKILQAENYDMLPEFIHDWAHKGFVKVYDAGNQQIAGLPSEGGEITASQVSPVREMSGEDLSHLDDFSEDEPDFASAREASLPINQTTEQMVARAKVSLGSQNESYTGDGLSPIPGDRPVSVDNSDKFTVRAPRGNHHVGAVIK